MANDQNTNDNSPMRMGQDLESSCTTTLVIVQAVVPIRVAVSKLGVGQQMILRGTWIR